MSSEESLIRDLLHGERTAQRELYDRYAGYAMAIGLRYIADREAVRDVLQECFLKILTSIGRFNYRGEGSLKAWITRIMANESLNYLRRNERYAFVADTEPPQDMAEETADEEPDIGGVPMAAVMHMIGELSVGYRTVFNLYVFEEKSHKEIAQLLGIGESSSASQYLRAKKILARRIKEYKNKRKT